MGSANLINIRQENFMALHGSIAKVMFNGAGGLGWVGFRPVSDPSQAAYGKTEPSLKIIQKVVPKTEAH